MACAIITFPYHRYAAFLENRQRKTYKYRSQPFVYQWLKKSWNGTFQFELKHSGWITPKPGTPNRAATFCRVPGDPENHNEFGHDHPDRPRSIVVREPLDSGQPSDQRQQPSPTAFEH
jgi:hypothetical protein